MTPYDAGRSDRIAVAKLRAELAATRQALADLVAVCCWPYMDAPSVTFTKAIAAARVVLGDTTA